MITKCAWTFRTAVACWRLCRRNPEEHWRQYVSAETFILRHAPVDGEEAAAILDVILDQEGDPRVDGLDRKALKRVRAFLLAIETSEVGRRAA